MNKKISLSIAICLAAPSSAYATNGYQLTGIGAYQKSLAGAVTAKPGSAMSAISNPAGMARVGKRADFSLEMFMPERFVDLTATGGEKNNSKSEQYGVPALGWTAPIDDGSDVYFGGGIYGTSGLGTDYPLTQFTPEVDAVGPQQGPAIYFEGYSAIQFWQMAPTVAWHHNDKLTFGVSLNLDYQSVSFRQAFLMDGDNTTTPTADGIADDGTLVNFDLSRTAQAFGYGVSLGVLYDINDDLTIGATYKSKQEFSDLEYQLAHGDIADRHPANFLQISGCGAEGNEVCPAGTYSLELDFPAMYSVGAAYQLNKFTSFSLDLKRIEWSKTLSALTVTGPNGEVITLPAGWDDQTIIAIGVEVAVNYKLKVRAGYNHAEAPFDEASVDSNYILPAVTQSHYAFGADYRINKYWEVGMHASKAADEILTSTATSPMPTNAKIGLGITTFGINLGYMF